MIFIRLVIGFMSILLLCGFQDTKQHSKELCSPNIAEIEGNIILTIICPGIPPKAIDKLNHLLNIPSLVKHLTENLDQATTIKRLHELMNTKDRKLTDLENKLVNALNESQTWAKRFQELENNPNISDEAKQALKNGDLNQAEALLLKSLDSGEKEVDRVAEDHYMLSQVYSLNIQPLKALQEIKKAYSYRPEVYKYIQAYAFALRASGYFKKGESFLKEQVFHFRNLTKDNPDEFMPVLAKVLREFAVFYSLEIDHKNDSEALLHEAIGLYRKLAQEHPKNDDFLLNLADTLFHLGSVLDEFTTGFTIIFYLDIFSNLDDAERAYKEAIDISRKLVQTNPDTDALSVMARALLHLYNLTSRANEYRSTISKADREPLLLEAIDISRKLYMANPDDHNINISVLVTSLYSLAHRYRRTNRKTDMETVYKEAFDISRKLPNKTTLALTLMPSILLNLGDRYLDTDRMVDAETVYKEALEILLIKKKPGLIRSNHTALMPLGIPQQIGQSHKKQV